MEVAKEWRKGFMENFLDAILLNMMQREDVGVINRCVDVCLFGSSVV